jgi:hypothetical protein
LPGIRVGPCRHSWPPWPGWGHSPNISLVPQRCPGHVPQRCPGHAPLTHRGWHKILWCNGKSTSSRRLSFHWPLTPSIVSFFFWFRGSQRKF